MSLFKNILFLILGFFLIIFSFYDIVYDLGLIVISIVAYFLLIFFYIYLNLRESKTKTVPVDIDIVEEFEKTLKGGLYHFKCQTCDGFFAIKKSKGDNKQYVKMTCPDCGSIGVIPPNPSTIEDFIPEKKSIKANFKCEICNERLTIWAEGTELYKKLHIFSCPYCGKIETMKKV
ncbi:MAG: hypothetical protein AYK22_03395 [Thermoplasmatales archaeon SG8-52-3]|nr:MAG: hypothetical protein AYK22_03395 [Thermoplasmatales archaeon SG8-52-3]